MPQVSVVLPAYNRAKVLPRAIDSVLAQDFNDFELLVVDDGSSDGTAEVARGYSDPRVRVIALERNGGSNAARNAGIENAAAPLIAFLDSDDAYLPHKLSTVARIFGERPGLEVLVDSYIKEAPPGAWPPPLERRNPVVTSTEEFERLLFARKLWKATSAISVTRDAAIRAGMFKENVARRQDFDFLARLAKVANCGATDETLWVKTWSPDSISERKTFMDSTLGLVERHPEYLTNPEYRVGLARDFARHMLLLVGRGRFARAGGEARQAIRQLGLRKAGGLMATGTRELWSRARKRGFKRWRRS